MNEVSSNSPAVPQPANRQEIFLVSGAFAVGVITLGVWKSAKNIQKLLKLASLRQ